MGSSLITRKRIERAGVFETSDTQKQRYQIHFLSLFQKIRRALSPQTSMESWYQKMKKGSKRKGHIQRVTVGSKQVKVNMRKNTKWINIPKSKQRGTPKLKLRLRKVVFLLSEERSYMDHDLNSI